MATLDRQQVYCGLDSCLTREIHPKLKSQLDEETKIIYDFERALQAPVLDMMTRGILTDPWEVSKLLSIYGKKKARIYYIIQKFAIIVWGRDLNPNSPKQMKEFFYERMNVDPIYKFEKGRRTITTNRDALEQMQQYRYIRPIATAVIAYRDMSKKIGVLRSGIDTDQRMRFSYNIGGTNTGRFSCNKNVFGGGTSGQNITDELRQIFVADEGKKLAYLDLEQAESRVTAYVSGDEAYIEACESDDLHVFVAKMVWPELNWSGDPELDKEKAEATFWHHWSRRDLSKRGGHLLNYYGQPKSNAKNLHVSIEVMTKFYRNYFRVFKGIKQIHSDVSIEIQTGRPPRIVTPLGRARLFFGRSYDDDVLRKAIAYRPQSTVADILNLGMWRIWKYMPDVQLLAQLHDAVLIQYDDDPRVEQDVLGRAIVLMTIPVMVTDIARRGGVTRRMVIPVDASVGWNWGKSKHSPDGLKAYKVGDDRVRQVSPSDDIMKRKM